MDFFFLLKVSGSIWEFQKNLFAFVQFFTAWKMLTLIVFQNAQASFSVLFRLKIAIPSQLSSDWSYADFPPSPQKAAGKERCLLSSIGFWVTNQAKTGAVYRRDFSSWQPKKVEPVTSISLFLKKKKKKPKICKCKGSLSICIRMDICPPVGSPDTMTPSPVPLFPTPFCRLWSNLDHTPGRHRPSDPF